VFLKNESLKFLESHGSTQKPSLAAVIPHCWECPPELTWISLGGLPGVQVHFPIGIGPSYAGGSLALWLPSDYNLQESSSK
jgi:hypothetical protein